MNTTKKMTPKFVVCIQCASKYMKYIYIYIYIYIHGKFVLCTKMHLLLCFFFNIYVPPTL